MWGEETKGTEQSAGAVAAAARGLTVTAVLRCLARRPHSFVFFFLKRFAALTEFLEFLE